MDINLHVLYLLELDFKDNAKVTSHNIWITSQFFTKNFN